MLLERNVVVSDARITQEIPGVVEEVVRHVCLTPARLSAFRAFDAVPFLVTRERRHSRIIRLEVFNERQQYRKIFLRYRHRSTRVTVDDRYGRTPVPLPRDAPIVEAIVHNWDGRPSFRQEL